MKMKRLFAVIISAMFLFGVIAPMGGLFKPMDASAYSQEESAQRIWHLDPVGGRNAYHRQQNVPQSVMNSAISAARKDAIYVTGDGWMLDYSNGSVSARHSGGVPFPDADNANSGILNVPYWHADPYNNNYKYSFQCADMVEVFLRDFVGYDGSYMDYNKYGTSGYGVGKGSAQGYFNYFCVWKSGVPGYDGHSWGWKEEGNKPGTRVPFLVPANVRNSASAVKAWFIERESATGSVTYNGVTYSEQIRKGALVFWWDASENRIHHVAIYVGNGQVLECSGSGNSRVHDIVAIEGKGVPMFYANLTNEAPKTGKITVRKESSLPAITDGSTCYDLEGVTFEIRDASGAVKDTLVMTAANHYTDTSKDLPVKDEKGNDITYNLVETVSGKGYEFDDTPIPFTLTAGSTINKTITNTPKNDPAGIKIQKVDADTEKNIPQGDGSLAGAVYEVRYFDSTTIDANWSTTGWTRHWYLKTNDNGVAIFDTEYLDPSRENSDLFLDGNGQPCLPLGTVLVKEVQAPPGYLLSDAVFGPFHITSSDHTEVVVSDEQHPDQGLIAKETVQDGQFSIYKLKEVENGDPVPEANIHFGVYNSKNAKVDELVTNDEGKATSKVLPYGTYTVKQLNTEFGYAHISPFTVNIPNDNNKEFRFVNVLHRSNLLLVKKDSDSEKPIPGITFVLKNAQGKYYQATDDMPTWVDAAADATKLVTNNEGKIFVEKLKHGKYYFVETEIVEPYLLDTTPHEALLDTPLLDDNNTVTIEITNDSVHGKIIIEKTGMMFDSVNQSTEEGQTVLTPVFEKHYLPGATFTVYADEDIYDLDTLLYAKGDRVTDIVTSGAGAVSSEFLPLGKYIVKETVVPEGYAKVADKPIELKRESPTQSIVIETAALENTFKQSEFVIEKVAEEYTFNEETGELVFHNNSKPGFIFGLYIDEDVAAYDGTIVLHKNDLVAVGKTDNDGKINIEGNFPIAQYYVKEIKAPKGQLSYVLDETKYPVTNHTEDTSVQVIPVKVTEEPIKNKYDKRWAQIVKVDAETGSILRMKGFKFQIFDADGNRMDTVETDEDGVAVIRIPLEHDQVYTVKEIAVADGFVLSNETFELHITEDTIEKIGDREERYTCRFENTRVKGSISVEKTGPMVSGFNPETVTIGDKSFDVTRLVITTEYLEGAVFELTAREDIVYNGEVKYHAGDVVKTITTTIGAATVDNLYLGKYEIKEISAPDGYVLVPNNTNIDLDYEGANVAVVTKNLSFGNDLRSMKATLEKKAEILGTTTDSEGNVDVVYSYAPGEGFGFGLYNAIPITVNNENEEQIPADTLIDICVSDSNGNVSFLGKYPVGQYYIKEIYALPKYQINDEFRFDIDNHVEDPTIPSLEFSLDEPLKNDYEYEMVKITKTDITGGNGLPGATIEVRDENDTVVYRHVTDEDGALEEIKLIPGDYVFVEIFAPNGYALSEEVIEFSISEDGELTGTTTMKDDVTRFSFYKIDESGKTLAGAEFTMYDEEGNVYAVVESDEDGIVTFENMLVGKYIIKETKALPDYQLSSESIELEVTNEWLNSNSYTDDGELMFSIMNYPTIKTGREMSTGAIIAIVAGSVALLVAVGLVVVYIRKKKHF